MIKLLTIIGARPQIVKAAALSRKIKKQSSDFLKEVILHRGNHNDINILDVFVSEIKMPSTDYKLDARLGLFVGGRNAESYIC